MNVTSVKGKAREEAHWQLGWWELYPLVDGPRRPVAWSSSSIIYTAHPTQPQVLARHFPSSRQFVLPHPPPVLETLASFDPPTIITVSPADDWIFAFIPSRDAVGIGCLWKKGFQIDTWTATEWWSFPMSAGVVCAEWMSPGRPWTVGDTGAPYRLPPQGPNLAMNGPTLLLITQTCHLHICILPPTSPSMKVVKLPLLQYGAASVLPVQTQPPQPSPEENSEESFLPDTGGRKLCLHAAIGFGYNESTLVIAMRSKFLPTFDTTRSTGLDVDLDLQFDITQQEASGSGLADKTEDDTSSTDWEQWGEDTTIDLCMVSCNFNGTAMQATSSPLPPIFRPRSQVRDLQFFAVPPDVVPASPTITRDPRRPVKEAGTSDKGVLYLAASFLDFDDYTVLPKSEVSLYSIILANAKTSDTASIVKLERTRTFEQGALAFLLPGPSKATLFAGFVDTAGPRHTRRSRKAGQTPIGKISVLKLPDLSQDERWEPSQILSDVELIGRDIPTGVVLSPNQAVICSLSPSFSPLSRMSIHTLPTRRPSPTQTPSARTYHIHLLTQAICSRKSPSDIIHVLAASNVSLDMVAGALHGAFSVLEATGVGLNDMWVDEILGVVTEVYLARSKNCTLKPEKDALIAQWTTAHDICSVAALNTAFEDCKEDDAVYDLDAVWQLIGLTSWLVGLLERILKQCVYAAEGNPSPKPWQLEAVDADPLSFSDAAALLHLIHPYALRNLRAAVVHVKRFRDQIHQASPATENAMLAKSVLMDVIDSSGVSLVPLIPLLEEFEKNLSQLPGDELRRALVTCSIGPSLRPFTRQAIDKILASQVINRPKLFLKPADLVHGVSNMSIGENPWQKNADVVSKGMLLSRPGGVKIVCTRCGGQSETSVDRRAASNVSEQWRAWEAMWSTRCVCGGAWARSVSM